MKVIDNIESTLINNGHTVEFLSLIGNQSGYPNTLYLFIKTINLTNIHWDKNNIRGFKVASIV